MNIEELQDVQEGQEAHGVQETQEVQGTKEVQEAKEPQTVQVVQKEKDLEETQEIQGTKEAQETKEAKGPQVSKEAKKTKEDIETKDIKVDKRRAEIIRQTKDDSVIRSPKKAFEANEAYSQKAQPTKKEDAPKKWYQKAWGGVKKLTGAAYKMVTGNAYSIAIAAVGLGLGIATGGTLPIAIGAVALAVKLTKTAIDAVKASKSRALDKENDMLIDYATALYVKQKTLDLAPKLKAVEKDLYTPDNHDKLSAKKQHKFNAKLGIAEKIANIINAGVDVAGIAMDPTKLISAGKDFVAGITIPLSTFNTATGVTDTLGATDDIKGLYESAKEKITKSSDLQAELRELINSERKRGNVGYDNLQELKEQTRQLQVNNKAMVAVLREENFYQLKPEQIVSAFHNKQQQLDKDIPALEKPDGVFARAWQGVKDALNPNSKYNPNNEIEANKHSGLTSAVRKEDEALEISAKPKDKPITRSMDDLEIKPKSSAEQKSASIDRTQLTEQLKQDQLKLYALTINKALHSTGHSQSIVSSNIGQHNNDEVQEHKATSSKDNHGR
jgi:hypothetical protein